MFDTIIIGAGPAGLNAFFYATMYELSCLCVGDQIGGKLNLAPHIIDYPGCTDVAGKDFINNLLKQLQDVKANATVGEVTYLSKSTKPDGSACFSVKTRDNQEYQACTLIIASGNGNKQRDNRGLKLANQLGLATERGLLKTNTACETSLPGVFAAGDCMHYPDSLEQLVTSVSSGARSAAGAFTYLKKTRPPILWGNVKIQRFLPK